MIETPSTLASQLVDMPGGFEMSAGTFELVGL